jgi:hypothetical protein
MDGGGYVELALDDQGTDTHNDFIAVDDTYVYVSSLYTSYGISRVPRKGGPKEPMLFGLKTEAMTLTPTYVYYGEEEPLLFSNSVKRWSIDGGLIEGVVSTQGTTRGLAVANGRVYAVVAGQTPSECYVITKSETENDSVKIATSQDVAGAIALDADYVYWITHWKGTGGNSEIHRTRR